MENNNIENEVMEDQEEKSIYEDLSAEEKALILTEVWVEYPDSTELVKKELGFGWKIVT